MRRWLVIAVVALATVAVAVTAGVYAAVREQRNREARLAAIDTAERFVAAWAAGDWDQLDALVADPQAGAGATHAEAAGSLEVTDAAVTLTAVDFDSDREAVASYEATLTLAGLGDWSYTGTFALSSDESGWAVSWTPATVHPELGEGRRLDRIRQWPARAPLLDRNGDAIGAGPLGGLAGGLGAATEEQLAQLGAPYMAGDVVGQSGLQRALERQLAGEPGGAVRVVSEAGDVLAVLHEFAVTEPDVVQTTLDPSVQDAGRSALAPVAAPSALVAVDVPTGEIRAVVNTPPGGFDRALSGRYPPGSTFKVVTTAALLRAGLDPAATVACPGTVSVGGRSFRNAGYAALGPISFQQAFAESCNTAFVGEADDLPDGALESAARQFGFNVDYDIGIPVADPRFPEPADAVEHAAAAIGQGRVEATPLHMATVAGAVARGGWVAPRILAGLDPAPAAEPLSEPVRAQLTELMRTAVATGTGTGAQVAGEPVAGKTGTAEFGTGSATHAWFVAFRGDVAVAVLVEGGGFGGEVAAPAAARFFAALG